MEGYNPSVSLLPQGSGVIHHMSGGNAPPNYDPSASLLPNVAANIGVYKGGGGSPAMNEITGQIRVIPNNGRVPESDEFSNQCMLISLVDHIKYRKALTNVKVHTDFTLKMLRDDVIQDDDKKIWPPNVEYDYSKGTSIKGLNTANKGPRTQNTILEHISNVYHINIYIRFKYDNKLSTPFFLLGSNTFKSDSTYSDAEIISYGNHFELYIPDDPNKYPNHANLGNTINLSGIASLKFNIDTINASTIKDKTIYELLDIQTASNQKLHELINTVQKNTNVNQTKINLIEKIHKNNTLLEQTISQKLKNPNTEQKEIEQLKTEGITADSYVVVPSTLDDSTITAISAILHSDKNENSVIKNNTNSTQNSTIAAISAILYSDKNEEAVNSTNVDERTIFLFKKTFTITNPMKTDEISDKNKEILKEFGLEKAENKIQLSILRSIWDIPSEIYCDTNASIASIGQCEPIRRLLDSLYLYNAQLFMKNVSKNANINYNSLMKQFSKNNIPSSAASAAASAASSAEAEAKAEAEGEGEAKAAAEAAAEAETEAEVEEGEEAAAAAAAEAEEPVLTAKLQTLNTQLNNQVSDIELSKTIDNIEDNMTKLKTEEKTEEKTVDEKLKDAVVTTNPLIADTTLIIRKALLEAKRNELQKQLKEHISEYSIQNVNKTNLQNLITKNKSRHDNIQTKLVTSINDKITEINRTLDQSEFKSINQELIRTYAKVYTNTDKALQIEYDDWLDKLHPEITVLNTLKTSDEKHKIYELSNKISKKMKEYSETSIFTRWLKVSDMITEMTELEKARTNFQSQIDIVVSDIKKKGENAAINQAKNELNYYKNKIIQIKSKEKILLAVATACIIDYEKSLLSDSSISSNFSTDIDNIAAIAAIISSEAKPVSKPVSSALTPPPFLTSLYKKIKKNSTATTPAIVAATAAEAPAPAIAAEAPATTTAAAAEAPASATASATASAAAAEAPATASAAEAPATAEAPTTAATEAPAPAIAAVAATPPPPTIPNSLLHKVFINNFIQKFKESIENGFINNTTSTKIQRKPALLQSKNTRSALDNKLIKLTDTIYGFLTNKNSPSGVPYNIGMVANQIRKIIKDYRYEVPPLYVPDNKLKNGYTTLTIKHLRNSNSTSSIINEEVDRYKKEIENYKKNPNSFVPKVLELEAQAELEAPVESAEPVAIEAPATATGPVKTILTALFATFTGPGIFFIKGGTINSHYVATFQEMSKKKELKELNKNQLKKVSKQELLKLISDKINETTQSTLETLVKADDTFEEKLLEITEQINKTDNIELKDLHNKLTTFLLELNKIIILDETESTLDNTLLGKILTKIKNDIHSEMNLIDVPNDIVQNLQAMNTIIDTMMNNLPNLPLGKKFIKAVEELLGRSDTVSTNVSHNTPKKTYEEIKDEINALIDDTKEEINALIDEINKEMQETDDEGEQKLDKEKEILEEALSKISETTSWDELLNIHTNNRYMKPLHRFIKNIDDDIREQNREEEKRKEAEEKEKEVNLQMKIQKEKNNKQKNKNILEKYQKKQEEEEQKRKEEEQTRKEKEEERITLKKTSIDTSLREYNESKNALEMALNEPLLQAAKDKKNELLKQIQSASNNTKRKIHNEIIDLDIEYIQKYKEKVTNELNELKEKYEKYKELYKNVSNENRSKIGHNVNFEDEQLYIDAIEEDLTDTVYTKYEGVKINIPKNMNNSIKKAENAAKMERAINNNVKVSNLNKIEEENNAKATAIEEAEKREKEAKKREEEAEKRKEEEEEKRKREQEEEEKRNKSSQLTTEIMLVLTPLSQRMKILITKKNTLDFNIFTNIYNTSLSNFDKIKNRYNFVEKDLIKEHVDTIKPEIDKIDKNILRIEEIIKQKELNTETKRLANEAKRKANNNEAKRKVNEEEAKRKANEEKNKANEEEKRKVNEARINVEEKARLKAERKAKYPLKKFREFVSQYTPKKYAILNNKNKPKYTQALKNLERLTKITKETIPNENKYTPDNMIERYEKSYKIYEDVLARQKQAELNNIQRRNPALAKATESEKRRIGLPPVNRIKLPPPIPLITPPKPPPKAFGRTYAQVHPTQKKNRTVTGGKKRYAKTIKKK